ncbi:MAG: WD40 repeat domain-containing protein [Ktedonobacteraceae bacterium]
MFPVSESNLSDDSNTTGLARIDVQLKAVLRGHTGGVTSLRFSSDGMILASIASDEICVWEREG